jgi:cell division protein FtsB
MPHRVKEKFVKNKKLLLWLIIIIVVVIAFLGKTITSLVHNKLEMSRLNAQIISLEKEYKLLQEQMELLQQQDPELIEKTARVQYHLVKPNEIEFRFKTKK